MQRITHVGVLVTSIDKALPLWVDQYGFQLIKRIKVLQEGVHSAFLALNGHPEEFMVELVEPMNPDDIENTVSRRLREHGEGLLHLAIVADDMVKVHERLRASQATFADREAVTAGCEPRVMVSPKANNGTLVEVLSAPDWQGVWSD